MLIRRFTPMVRHFMQLETAGGALLVFATLLAMICVNTPLSGFYAILFSDGVVHLINDGLMAVFFLLVGLEIKREYVIGELSSSSRALLPVVAALGGVVVPPLIFIMQTWQQPLFMVGWAIPAATDIAFVLGVLAVLGSRVPLALKVFVTAIAVIDDLAAIIIIALFYSYSFDLGAFCGVLATLVVLYFMNMRGVTHLGAYLIVGLFLWLMVLHSGIHATIAGVLLALFIPLQGCSRGGAHHHSPLEELEHRLHPHVTFWILPLFALANAGVSLWDLTFQMLTDPVVLGISLGLFLGKQIGIFAAIYLAVRMGYCRLPDGVNWVQVYGAAILCGIGFTMSIFIGELAYHAIDLATEIRVGVLMGSLLSAGCGYALLRYRHV